MWSDMFGMDLSVWEKVIRAVAIYLFLVLALRLVGKRELSQLNTLDFVVLLAVANAVQNGLIGPDNSVTGAVLGASVLFVVDGALAFVLFRNKRLARTLMGTPTVLVDHGRVLEDALRQVQFTRDDLILEIQAAGVLALADVEKASLQPSGKVIVTPRRDRTQVRHYEDLVRRLEELTAKVEALDPGRGTGPTT